MRKITTRILDLGLEASRPFAEAMVGELESNQPEEFLIGIQDLSALAIANTPEPSEKGAHHV
jgi:hypothetical protein